ncbi:MAG TPA: ABC transporter substrate-binding protein [Ktedonobacteraceae bacterium]|nr:ABC transporter substrate-binding protein [Ktedonobacteraceae bacterium]
MECPYCHAQNRAGVRFCSNCGRQMPQSQQGQSSSAIPPTVVATAGQGLRGSSSSLSVGTPLQGGRYIIKDILGQGGMGAALLATDKRLDSKLVVIKELISDGSDPQKLQEDEANFKREVVTLAHLDHPLIPNVTDNFDENSRFFMVQEYVEGENLEDHMDRLQQPMRERDVLTHASQILDVLDYLSQQTPPIVHRDIKPANIIISAKDKKAHLVDFGIARADVARNARRKQTSALGTPGYAPPEQYQGNADPRSDLYALGATLHHLLTNRDPRNFQPFNYPPVRTLNAQLSPEVENLLLRTLTNDINLRYQSAAAMKRDVDDILYKRFGISSGSLGGYATSGSMATVGSTVTVASLANTPTVMNPLTPSPVAPHPSTPPLGLYPQPPAPRQSHAGRNIFLVLIALLLVGGLAYGAFSLTRRGGAVGQNGTPTATPAVVNGIGVTRAADGEYIGISNGTFAFDTSRPDGLSKQQAAAALKAGNTSQAQGLLQQALNAETNDPEALIYLENQKVLAAGGFHVTIVVATMLTGANAGVGRDDLQGAYVAQKTFNDGSLLGGIGVVLLIANAGSQNANAPAVARQIVQAAQADPSIVGVMGWPFSSYVSSTINIFKAAKIPLVSPTASSDLLSGISPYFFRVCPSNKIQGIAGAKYVAQNLHARSVIVFADPLDPYSSSLASDFTAQFRADGNTVLGTEKYTVGKSATIASALQDALTHTNPAPDAFYFSGYAPDISTLLTGLPTTGQFANLQVMGGDALYELSGYQSSSRVSWNRLHFTSFTYPDVWGILGLNSQIPAFFANYQDDFNPGHAHKGNPYGWDRPDSDVMLSYDATTTLLMAAKNTGKSQIAMSDVQKALTQLNGAHAFQGVSGQIAFGTNGDPINKAMVVLNVSPEGFIHMDPTIEGQFLLT